ncbi:MAG: hypothetical protein ACSLFP_01280 [Acidimicrobiales bacterium]
MPELPAIDSLEELWVALAAGLIMALALVLSQLRHALPLLTVLIVTVVAAPADLRSLVTLGLAAFVAARPPRGAAARLAEVTCSLAAVLGAYLCTPDTEHAQATLGALTAAGAAAVAFGVPWRGLGRATTVLLLWIAATDAWARPSAVAATVGIAALHLAAQRTLQRTDSRGRRGAVAIVVVAAAAVAARHAGLDPGTAAPMARTVAIVAPAALVVVALTGVGRRAARMPGQRQPSRRDSTEPRPTSTEPPPKMA